MLVTMAHTQRTAGMQRIGIMKREIKFCIYSISVIIINKNSNNNNNNNTTNIAISAAKSCALTPVHWKHH